MPRINREHLERFFHECLSYDDRHCVEVLCPRAVAGSGRRIIRNARDTAFGGWFTDPAEMACELDRVDGVSAYCTLNPVKLGSRSPEGRNTLRHLRKNEGCKDEDIGLLRWMSLDVDPPRARPTSASTDAELADCARLRDRICEERCLQGHALRGISGNGALAVVRLADLPNDPLHRNAVAAYVDSLKDYKGDIGASVDIQLSVSAPSRMIAVPGSLKCRGDVSTPERPWRLASVELREVTPFDLMAWVEEHGLLRPSLKLPKVAPPPRAKDAYRQAREWLFSGDVGAARSGEEGHNQTFGIACSLVKGFMLSPDEATSLLRDWNRGCDPPWEDHQLARKAAEADRAPDARPRGWMLRRGRFDGMAFTDDDPVPEVPTDDTPESYTPDTSGKPDGPIDDPVRLATLFQIDHQVSPGCCRYRWYAGVFWMWDGSHYKPIEDKEFDSLLLLYIDRKLTEWNEEQYEDLPPDKQDTFKPRRLNRAMLELCKTALRGIVTIPGDYISGSFWIGRPMVPEFRPDEIIPFHNRLVHLPSFATGRPKSWIANTPHYFSTYSLDYRFPFDRYDGPVEPPDTLRWFLDSTHAEDPETQLCLREIAGYILTSSNRFQKLFMLIGSKRSGKGTWLRIFEHMIGVRNTCFPTFSSLAAVPFGKQQLLDKTLAVMGDARLSGRTDVSSVVETILSITGNDPQTVQRKNISDVTKRLSCRFVITSNELPRFTDMSGALLSRAVIIRFSESFEGREDFDLEAKLIPEIPAITRWAIDGWVSLHQRGRFLQPASGQKLLDELRKITSPVLHFLDDQMDRDEAYSEDGDRLYQVYRDWCGRQGRESIQSRSIFERDLMAAIPRLAIEDGRVVGIRLRPAKVNGELLHGRNGSGLPSEFSEY